MFNNYAHLYDLIYKNRDYKAEAEMVYKWAGKPKCIYDLGCGTGRHHKFWKCRVAGFDKSSEMLNFVSISPNVSYLKSDIESKRFRFCFSGHEVYTALFNVMGYCNLKKVIGNLRQKKGGIFIFDVWDKEKFSKDGGFRQKIKKFTWGEIVIKPVKNGLKISWQTNNQKGFEYHSVRPYSEEEIKKIAKSNNYKYEKKNTNTWTTWYKFIKL